MFESRLLSVEVDRIDVRILLRAMVEGGARGVLGAGKVNVKVCMVEAGCSVEAMISTSRVKESLNN